MSSSKQRLHGTRARDSKSDKPITNTKDDTAKPVKKHFSRSLSRRKVDSGLFRRETKENKENSMSNKDQKSSSPPTKPRI